MTLKLPIGTSDFKTLIQEEYQFVDKSLFIKDILNDSAKVILISRPRRFGKTLNMSMLYYYLTDATDEADTHLFNNLLINQEHEVKEKHYHKYPTVFITLKSLKSATFDDFLIAIKTLISGLYDQYGAIFLASDNLTEQEKQAVKNIISKSSDSAEIKDSLKNLIFYLYKIYGKKSVLLIDEYDAPIHEAYVCGYYDEMIRVMSGFLGEGLKDSKYLQKGVVTGVARIAQASIFSEVNNFKAYSVLAERYGEYFGFTEPEVWNLLSKANATESKHEIKDWYNGYYIGGHTVYNPWSILNCLSGGGVDLRPHWVNTSSNDLIKQQLKNSPIEAKELLEQLMQGNAVSRAIDEDMIFQSLETNPNALWSLLLFAGYLTIGDTATGRNGLPYGLMSIPNKEIASLYIKIIEEWLVQGMDDTAYQSFIEGFNNYDVQPIELYLQKYMIQSGSHFDFHKKSNDSSRSLEQSYHVFVLGLVAGLGNKFIIKSNQEAGLGRYDVALIPRDHTKTGIILEFKTAADDSQLEKIAMEAVQQIEDKKYAAVCTEQGISSILLIGMAFFGKSVKLASKKI